MFDTITNLICAIFYTFPAATEAAHNATSGFHFHARRLW